MQAGGEGYFATALDDTVCVNTLPLDGEESGGVTPQSASEGTRPRAAGKSHPELGRPGSVTPTLTRPLQGGGNREGLLRINASRAAHMTRGQA